MARHPYVFVFFVHGGRPFVSVLVRALTLSRIGHCAIAYDGAVIDPRTDGNIPYPLDPYIEHYPGLIGCFTVQLARPISLDDVPLRQRKPWLPSFIRWFTFGLFPASACDDCVCTVIEILRRGGINVPRRIVSPRGLFRWLSTHGYPPHEYTGFE